MNKDFNKALKYSFLLLKYRARSKNELVQRLEKKGYAAFTIGQAVAYLQENGYIDDKKFTQLFVSDSLDKGWGSGRIVFKLRELEVAEELIEQALARAGLTMDDEYEYQ